MSKTIVLIDDDQIIRNAWDAEARKKGILLVTFPNISTFLNDQHLFDRETELYIDSFIEGESLVLQIQKLSQLGFKCIYLLESISNVESLTTIEGVKAVYTKNTPF